MPELQQPEFLPTTRAEMDALGWDELDVLLVSGDAYVDSHSFAAALLGRWLVAHGYRAGIIAQPAWEDTADVLRMGRPRLFAAVSPGALDSMLAHYTAFRKKRGEDAYSPGGKTGLRPNRAGLVYTGLLRRAFPGLPVAIGGIEASLRRASHYDFWSDSLRRSILLDSKADILLYGMGEKSILDLADLLGGAAARQRPMDAIAHARLRGSVYAVHPDAIPGDAEELPSHEAILDDAGLLMKATLAFERQMLLEDPCLVQRSAGRAVVFEPPAALLSEKEMDAVYALPFTRRAHPSYAEEIPAVAMIEGSVTSHRGCGGGCSFCALAIHQGRRVQSRSEGSILREVEALARRPEWKGSLTDIGGPSANMWQAACDVAAKNCKRASCLFPKRCRHFHAPQEKLAALLRRAAALPGVKHLRVASGVRHDLAVESAEYMRALVGEFTGGQLKIAPEHINGKTLRLMRKTPLALWNHFLREFNRLSGECGKEQYVVPYLMSAFPGCTDADMEELAAWLKVRGWRPQQVQCFIPSPGTVATAMFYAKQDEEGLPIHVARTDGERLFQHRILVPDAEPSPRREEDPRAERGGRKPFGAKKPFRKPLAGKKEFRKPFESKKEFDKPFGAKKEFRKPSGAKKEFTKPFGEKKEFAKPFSEKKGFKKPFGAKKEFTKPFGEKKEFAKPFGAKKEFTKPFAAKKDSAKPFSGRKPSGAKKSFAPGKSSGAARPAGGRPRFAKAKGGGKGGGKP